MKTLFSRPKIMAKTCWYAILGLFCVIPSSFIVRAFQMPFLLPVHPLRLQKQCELLPRTMLTTTKTKTCLHWFGSGWRQNKDEVELTFGNKYIPIDSSSDLLVDKPNNTHWESIWNIVVPLMTPIVAFATYEEVREGFNTVLDIMGPGNWVVVDGGEYQTRIITPAINGVVVPAVAVLFATLTSTTISSLRDRQVQVRHAINMEAGELRTLECLLDAFPPGQLKSRAREYLIQYTGRLISESSPKLGSGEQVTNPRRGMDSELNALIKLLNEGDNAIPSLVLSEAFSSIAKLREERQSRITALQSTFPVLHYVILMLLAAAQCFAFLIETNSSSLLFLNALQLRVLWSMLIATLASCFAVFSDLRIPFSGSYQISASVDQLYLIRLTLQASAQMEQKEHERAIQNEQNNEETIKSETKPDHKSGRQLSRTIWSFWG